MGFVDAIVPAYPYEGGLYWLFGEVTTRHSLKHSYYRSLYGLEPEKVAVRAGALEDGLGSKLKYTFDTSD